jgi:CubicO group peptidase (beta-lactamase class C family)
MMTSQIGIHGFCDDAFIPLKEAFEQNFAAGLEIGASFAVSHRGKMVVDLWAGYSDRDKVQPWQEDTIACVFSSTKIMAITSLLMVIDRGLIELDQPIVKYWPEFGAHGKDQVTVRDALTYRALVPSFQKPVPHTVAYDWEKMVELIADEKPWFELGTFCYHPTTYGHILGELVRRVTGQDIREFFLSELAHPLGADFHMGLTDKQDRERVALLTHTAPLPFEEGSIEARVMGAFLPPPDDLDVWQSWRRQSALVPAWTGHGNARSMVKIGNMLAMGGTVGDRCYLSKEMIDEARSEQCHEICPLMGDIVLGLGFGLDGDFFMHPDRIHSTGVDTVAPGC